VIGKPAFVGSQVILRIVPLANDAIRPEDGQRAGQQASAQESLKESMSTNLIDPPLAVDAAERRFPELTDELEKELVQVFKLLSDETRLRILAYLAREGELHVTALCDRLGQSQPAVSHHLALLRVAGLIKARRDGKHNYYSVRQSRFRRLMEQVFHSMGEAGKGRVRFDEFIVTHEQ
jgi:ArsR family transcriptional regulator, arsenate/arsenite/antimonite-responsive transcriptional repressor